MPRGVVLLASLVLLIVAGIATAVGLLVPGERDTAPELPVATGGDPEHGKQALVRYGCVTCHRVPGIPEANGLVGPPLDHFASRVYVAGMLPNTPENLVAWILDPPAIDPMTAMPATGISESEARDIAALLYSCTSATGSTSALRHQSRERFQHPSWGGVTGCTQDWREPGVIVTVILSAALAMFRPWSWAGAVGPRLN